MNLRTFLIAGVSTLLGLCLTLVIVDGTWAQALVSGGGVLKAAKAELAPASGRYQAVSHGDHLFLIDTATGQGWRADPHAANRNQSTTWLPVILPKP